MGKLDNFVEQVTRKVAVYLGEVLEDQRDKLHENLLANNSESYKVNNESAVVNLLQNVLVTKYNFFNACR